MCTQPAEATHWNDSLFSFSVSKSLQIESTKNDNILQSKEIIQFTTFLINSKTRVWNATDDAHDITHSSLFSTARQQHNVIHQGNLMFSDFHLFFSMQKFIYLLFSVMRTVLKKSNRWGSPEHSYGILIQTCAKYKFVEPLSFQADACRCLEFNPFLFCHSSTKLCKIRNVTNAPLMFADDNLSWANGEHLCRLRHDNFASKVRWSSSC